jgi:hypothetical protein
MRRSAACCYINCNSLSKQLGTTKQNLDDYIRQIPLHTLPATFRDSICVTRQLGIQYPWIDCLCIVQDDEPDWHTECRTMSSTYENSFLTIPALRAKDSYDGLFHERKYSMKPVVLELLDDTCIGVRP